MMFIYSVRALSTPVSMTQPVPTPASSPAASQVIPLPSQDNADIVPTGSATPIIPLIPSPALPPPLKGVPSSTQVRRHTGNALASSSAPRHVSQMPDVFNARHDAMLALAARKREITAERTQANLQVEHEISVTVWKMVST